MLSMPEKKNNQTCDVGSIDDTLPSSGTASEQNNRAVYTGDAIDDLSSLGSNKETTNTSPSSYSQSWWMKHKLTLLGATIGLIMLLVISVVGAAGAFARGTSNNKEKIDLSLKADGALANITGSPTSVPTSSPSVTPQWDINYLGFNADFSSDYELVVDYEIGINRIYSSEIYAHDCTSPITGMPLQLAAERKPKTMYADELRLQYKIDKGKVTGSNIWNEETEQLQLCQILSLVHPLEDGSAWTITEDKRTLDVTINLNVGFGIDLQIELAPAESELSGANATGEVGIDEGAN